MLALLFAVVGRPALAGPNVALDNILVSKQNGITNIQIWPACTMSYEDHVPTGAGLELRIRVRTDGECAELLQEVSAEAYLPLGRRLGNVDEVLFDALGGGDTFITLRFSRASQFEVRQHPVGWIEILVDTNVDSSVLPASVPPPLDAEPPAVVAAPRSVPEDTGCRATRTEPARRRVTAPRVVAPSATGEFVVQLGVFESAERAVRALQSTGTPHFAYVTDFEINGRDWHGLQVGFFDSETDAEAVLDGLRNTFPDSWVRYVNPDEARAAQDRGDLRASLELDVPAVRVSRDDAGDGAEIDALMSAGRQAMLDRRYEDAISSYTSVLEVGGHSRRADAREYIGVAYERSGQTEHAIAEYRAFLDEFPSGDGAARVDTRLTSLTTAAVPTVTARAPASRSGSGDRWQVFGGVSQYYWRNQEQIVHDGNYRVTGSGVLLLGDVTAQRRGSRFDVFARANGGYEFNLVEYDDDGNAGWLSNAFVDVTDLDLGLQARVGRQTRPADGVIDRFDGAALTYQWKPDLAFSVSAGFPVDSPRFVTGTQRFFYAASARMEDLWDRLDVTAYTQQQTVDGITDRQAVGGEVRLREGPLRVVGLLDYDLSYQVLNTLLVNGSWLLDNGWRVNGMLRAGAQPYLTTRNALTGQTARSIDELSETYTEGQIRTLARDRTADALTASVGIDIPLSERLDLSLDVSTRAADATVASGGVASIPETGTQFYVNANLVGSSLLRQGDLTLLTLRHDATRTRDSSTVIIDTRLPFGEGLRINPRLSLTRRIDNASDTEQIVATPSIRILYRWRSLMLDLEAGGRWSSRDLPPGEIDAFTPDGTEELTGGFVNLGYRLEF